ncbi:MAG: hypothetical protein RLZZ450_334 [Pseudomonadota bacterium]|jgi:hypothetical protein
MTRDEQPSPQAESPPPRWALLALLVIAAAALWPYRHFAGDDASITFRFVRSLVDGMGYSFNPGHPTYGSTAPLWVFLIAIVTKLGLGVADSAHLLNALFAALSVISFWQLAAMFIRRPLVLCLAGLLYVLNPWFVRWSMSGMENGLSLWLWTLAVLHQLRSRDAEGFNWVSPACAALATLTRPEMTVFSLLLFADTLLFRRERKLRELLLGGVLYGLLLVPWVIYAYVHFGSLIPNTISAKLSRDHVQVFVRTLYFMGSFWPFHALCLVVAALLGKKQLGPWLRSRAEQARWFLIVGWGLALPAFYVVGGAPISGRYLMFALPSYVLVGAAVFDYLLEVRSELPPAAARAIRALVVASTLGTLALLGYVQYRYCWYVTRWPEGMDPPMIEVARYLRDHSAPGASVAADQIGVLGYFSERTVIDIGALASPEMLPYRKMKDKNAIWRHIRERAPEFLFVIDDVPLLVSRDPGYASVELMREVDVQREGASSAGGLQRFRLYRTHWTPTKPAH